MKSFATSGVRLHFRTDSRTLFLRTEVSPGSSRSFFCFDIFVDGQKIDTLCNFKGAEAPYPMGVFSKEFNLGTGEKDVCVYFPWSVKAVLKEISLDDGAIVRPIKPKHQMLCFGDSITQGYDARYPSNKYISRIANLLDAQEHNKAIAGETFFPELPGAADDFQPKYITVAYGTNDWNGCLREELLQNCGAFFANLAVNYPDAKVLVITPIWRKDMHEERPCGPFEEVDGILRQEAAKYPRFTVVNGFAFVPRDETLFADLVLHPNDRGFDYYYSSLAAQIKDLFC